MAKVLTPTDDPYDFVVRERPRDGGGRDGGGPPDLVEDAYRHARLFLDLDFPFSASGRAPFNVEGYFPEWVVERALAKMVKDGVIRGPSPVPRTKRGKGVLYHLCNESGKMVVMWAEGRWRILSSCWVTDLRFRAKRQYNLDRRIARRHLLPPGKSKTLMVKDYARSLRAADWDGLAYFPVKGKAMDELISWRERTRRTVPDVGPLTECPRCGVTVPGRKEDMRVLHPKGKCNLLIITRIMES
jgi:hypothetical protein